jgi:hypothetical protein
VWGNLERKEVLVASASIALVIYTLSLSMFSSAVSTSQTNKTISSSGSLVAIGVGIYSDADLTNKVSSINWGIIEPGSNVNVPVYIRNEGNSAATLFMTQSNWYPSNAASYMNLSWNYSGQYLSAGASIQVELTLSVSESVEGITDFGFDITITTIS